MTLLALAALFVWARYKHPFKQQIQRIHQSANQHIALGDYESAQKELKPLLSDRLCDSQTKVLYARILRAQGKNFEALSTLQEALEQEPKNLTLTLECARSHLQDGQAEEALEHFALCSALLRDEVGALDYARALFQTGRVAAAWEKIEGFVPDSSNGRLLSLAADCQFQEKHFELAANLYLRALRNNWSNQQTLIRAAHSLRASGSLLEAERLFRSIIAYDSGDLAATLGLGGCLEARGQFSRALMIYQGGHAWDEGDPLLLRQAGICAVHTQQESYAEFYLKEAISRGAQSPQALAFLGYSLECQAKWEEAEDVYLKLAEEYPEHVVGYKALAWLYGVGRSTQLTAEQGLFYAQKALEFDSDARSWELLSACEARAGNFSKAHTIHEQLSQQCADPDEGTQRRRRSAMRSLRRRVPLDEQLLPRELVA